MLRLQFVYVLTGELGFVKIGICQPPEFPADSIKTGSIRPMEIVWVAATNGDAHQIELDAHRILGASRHSNEWFAIAPTAAIRAVERAAHDLDHPLLSVGPLNSFAKPLHSLNVFQSIWLMMARNFWFKTLALLGLCAALGFVAFHSVPQIHEVVSRLFRFTY